MQMLQASTSWTTSPSPRLRPSGAVLAGPVLEHGVIRPPRLGCHQLGLHRLRPSTGAHNQTDRRPPASPCHDLPLHRLALWPPAFIAKACVAPSLAWRHFPDVGFSCPRCNWRHSPFTRNLMARSTTNRRCHAPPECPRSRCSASSGTTRSLPRLQRPRHGDSRQGWRPPSGYMLQPPRCATLSYSQHIPRRPRQSSLAGGNGGLVRRPARQQHVGPCSSSTRRQRRHWQMDLPVQVSS